MQKFIISMDAISTISDKTVLFRVGFLPRKGFTVIEMLVVISLMAMITVLGLFVGIGSYQRFSFYSDRDIVVAALQSARAQAVNNICLGDDCSDGKRHGVYFDNAAHRLVIFQGDSYSVRENAVDEAIDFEGGATQVNPETEVVFDQLSGNNYSGGVVLISMSDGIGQAATISVNSVGRIDF